MADRFWVGGTNTWNATAGTKWATTNGGAGGAPVPTAADNVFFTAASGAVTVTIGATANCLSLDCTGFIGTINGSSTLNIAANCTFVPAMTWSHTGAVILTATLGETYSVTSAGKTFNAGLQFGVAASSVTWELQDALSVTGNITHTSGTITTNNYAITAATLQSANSNTRTINLGSSTVTLSATATFTTTTGLTFNAGTSNIRVDGGAVTFAGGGLTFNNVQFRNTTASTITVTGNNTFGGLDVYGPAIAGVRQVTFSGPQLVSGLLKTVSTAANRRVWFRSATSGIAQTLTVNGGVAQLFYMYNADFSDIYAQGSGAPLVSFGGARLGDRGGCRGITFDAPITSYWNQASGGNWSDNAWAASSGGSVNLANFPLAQDTAIIGNTGLNASAAIATPNSIEALAVGTLDASGRTLAMTLTINVSTYYGDFTLGSGVTLGGSSISTFSGRNIQTITSAGKAFPGGVTIDSFDGTVQLADDFTCGGSTLTVTCGSFITQGFALGCGLFQSNTTFVRAIDFGSSTITLYGNLVTTATNLTFSAGTSQINFVSTGQIIDADASTVLYNVSNTETSSAVALTITRNCTFNNLTVAASSSAGIRTLVVGGNITVAGTLTAAGASPVRRIFLRSNVLGTQRDLTVGTLVANDCDFRDIEILGAAIGTAPTRAGDCGGNSNITFPSPKTVYWNLAGSPDWSGTGWATTSGGTPVVNNFPLAQDTAVFDNAMLSAVTIYVNKTWNIGTVNASARTITAEINTSLASPFVYGDWTFGTGVTSTGTSSGITFAGRGTQTITSNGVSFGCPITVDSFSGTVQLANALTISAIQTLTVTSGTFDAVTYNVTTGLFSVSTGINTTLKMGSGTWTLSGTGTVWSNLVSSTRFYRGTANIVLSNTSTTARTFAGNSLTYNKLTIGGTTGISTTTITGNNVFSELASTKTVAHTIALGTTAQAFGAWTVSGTVGNVVTVSGTGTTHIITGARVSGVNFLAMGTLGFSTLSFGEFYAGANSTGTGAGIIRTAAPAPVTRYWRGGTGTWSDTLTTNWSATSGGAGGASVPTSVDAVVFNSASNATAYTVTCTSTPYLRCASLTIAGPASGNVTWAGAATLVAHGDVTLPATGLTRTYAGTLALSGSATGKTLTTNGVALGGPLTVNGEGCGWSLGSALSTTTSIQVVRGSFDTANYAVTLSSLNASNASTTRAITLGSSTLTFSGLSSFVDFGIDTNLAFDAGTSTINVSIINSNLNGGTGQTFYDVNFNYTSSETTGVTLSGANTFRNLTIAGLAASGMKPVNVGANQTVTGTLTLSAGADATCRTFVRSNSIGTTRTLTCAAVAALTDIDFRDITIAGAAAPVSGTRLGDCKGNSGITFDAAKTVYRRGSLSSWGGPTSWAATDGGAPDSTQFPLAQDTAVIPASAPPSAGAINMDASYNIGTIDMSARTSNTMTLATGTQAPYIHGDWINGTGTALSGTGTITFAGRGSQTITSAGVTFTQPILANSAGGVVSLLDAFNSSYSGTGAFTLASGTFDANGYNVTLSGSSATAAMSGAAARTMAVGSGTWTIAGNGNAWLANTPATITITGTGTISLTSASAKTFSGGGLSYAGITLDQGGLGTLTITGNNTFANISNTAAASGPTIIAMSTTTQTVANFTASGGGLGDELTIQGTSAASPATLVFSGTGQAANVDYVRIIGVRAYGLVDTWYAGNNSLNFGSLGWYFEAGSATTIYVFITESATTNDTNSATGAFTTAVSETASGSDAAAAGMTFLGTLSESATVSDVVAVITLYLRDISESTRASDLVAATMSFARSVSELVQASETVASTKTMPAAVAETVRPTDTINAGLLYLSSISEATTASEIAAAARAFNAAVLEATSASEITAAQAAFLAVVPESVSGSDVLAAFATLTGSVAELATAADAARRAKVKFVDLENYVATEATTTALSVEASVTSNTASGTVESGQITATVLP